MMSSWRQRLARPLNNVSTRIAIPAGFFALVSVALLSFVLIQEQREQVLDEVVHGSDKLAEAVLLSLEQDMRTNDPEGVHELIRQLVSHDEIESIRIITGTAAGVPRDRSRVFTDTAGRKLVATTRVIHNRADCRGAGCHDAANERPVMGVLEVATSLEPAHRRLAGATRNAILISSFAVGLITLILVQLIRQAVRTQSIAASRMQAEQWARELEEKVAAEARELRDAQFQIVQAEKLSSVGLMAAGIAHELNSPLMAIITFSHLVRGSLPAESQAHEDLRMIEREANRCAAIIRQLLDYSRKQSQDPVTHPCTLTAIVRGALDLLKVELQNTAVQFHVDIAEDLPAVEANEVQLMQIFVNLLVNAIQAMPEGGEISLRGDVVSRDDYACVDLPPHRSDALVRIRVRDTGTGIAESDIARVFDPFFTTKPVGKGSGLGLSVSLGLVRNYRGTILVESDGASWTEFTVLLPALPQPALVASL